MVDQSVAGLFKSARFDSLVAPLKEIKMDRKLALEFAAAGLVGFGVYYIGKVWNSYGYFKKRGIPTPPYSFFYGNLNEILDKGYGQTIMEWTKKYGKVYGYYEGHLPVLVTSDIDMVDEIFYKQFGNFSARKILPINLSDESPNVNVFAAARNRWKRLRTISNQTFSPAKLKEMLPAMRMCSDRLIEAISKHSSDEINITDLIDQLTMDVLWNCTFGIDVDFINNSEFVFYDKIRQSTNLLNEFQLFVKLTTFFFELKPFIVIPSMVGSLLLSKVSFKWGNPIFWLLNQVSQVLDKKVQDNKSGLKKKNDYVQLLIDAEADRVNLDFDNKHYESDNTKLIQKKMTQSEIFASLVGFMLAGFDTTASTLIFCFYVLLTHPEELSKLQEEADSLPNFEYESINQLEYLDMFIKEVLRMYPVAISVQNRRCTKATTLKGIEIPEELQISIDVLSLHYDPEYWPGVDPHTFYPQRFAPNAAYNKLAYMPFGAGARICIGMRFAFLEIKITLAKILRNFDISSRQELPNENILLQDGFLFAIRRLKQPILINFTKRV